MNVSNFILLGKILSPHGVRGQVKILSHTDDPEDIIAYGPLYDKSGKRTFALTLTGGTKNSLIASVEGIADRDQAETLRNTELYVPRAALPAAGNNEYYQTDLIGLPVFTESNGPFGTLAAFHDFGAGTLAEIRFDNNKTELYSFTEKNFPVIDPVARRIVINVPPVIEEDE